MFDTSLFAPKKIVLTDVFDSGGLVQIGETRFPRWMSNLIGFLPRRFGVGRITGAYYLEIANQRSHQHCDEGDYVLTYRGDAVHFSWDNQLLIDPFEGLTDDEADALPDDAPESKQWLEFFNWIHEIEDGFDVEPFIGYTLYRACRSAGYNPEKDGHRLIYWMMNHIGRKVSNTDR